MRKRRFGLRGRTKTTIRLDGPTSRKAVDFSLRRVILGSKLLRLGILGMTIETETGGRSWKQKQGDVVEK